MNSGSAVEWKLLGVFWDSAHFDGKFMWKNRGNWVVKKTVPFLIQRDEKEKIQVSLKPEEKMECRKRKSNGWGICC